QKLRAFELDRHFGELPLQALEFCKRLAELLAGACVLARTIVAVAAEGERAGGVADTLDVEPRHLLLEAARTEQHVLGADAAILEMQFAPQFAAHELLRRADREALGAAF